MRQFFISDKRLNDIPDRGKRGSLKRKLASLLVIAGGCVTPAMSQELNCTVEVNSQAIEGSSKTVFEELKSSISEYLNETKFSNATFSPIEKIECRFFLTVKEYKDDRIKGELQLQLSRPVYNSTYTTTLFNFRDTRVEFDYKEGDPLVFNETTVDSNLRALIDFYAYLFLALDFDSFSPKGGQPFYDKAASILQQAQSLGEVGWRAFEDPKNRSGVLTSFTDPGMAGVRDMLYQYHRKGLDEMVTSPDKGREAITKSIQVYGDIYRSQPMSVALSLFRDAKLDELVNVYSKAPQTERDEVYTLLEPIFPADRDRLEKIRKPAE